MSHHHIDKTHLKVGDIAPNFEAMDQNGQTKTLNDYIHDDWKGDRLILYFYPKDDTPTCTKEAQNFRDNYDQLKGHGFEVVGISPDSVEKHKKFSEKYDLPFPLLADTNHKIAEDYGVWGDKKFMGKVVTGILRTTFVIDKRKHIELVIEDVHSDEASKQILEYYQTTKQ